MRTSSVTSITCITGCVGKDHRRRQQQSTGSCSKGSNQQQIVDPIMQKNLSKADFIVKESILIQYFERHGCLSFLRQSTSSTEVKPLEGKIGEMTHEHLSRHFFCFRFLRQTLAIFVYFAHASASCFCFNL